jgi:predicted metalloprotease
MRWRDGRRSDNVEDMRGRGGGGGMGGGGGGFKLGIGGLVLAAAAYFLGVDPRMIMGIMQATQGGDTALESGPVETSRPTDEGGDFLSVVLADTEDTWTALFSAAGAAYSPPRLRLYEGGTQSGCGSATADAGPFYCPADQRVYIDLAFFRELEQRFQAPGDFAQAYVLAHEVGHHVQTITGISDKVRAAQQRASEEDKNALQVRMELQADCYAGIWAHHAQRTRAVLEAGDIEEAMGAASAVGDDMIQKRAQGYVVPESFTHGSAAQRKQWFGRGFDSGQVSACDTFAAR